MTPADNPTADSVAIPVPDRSKSWFGHPRELSSLFTIEMWERFGFYGMRAILVLYLTKHFLFSDSQAYGLFTAYVSLVYLTPFVGGLIADRYLGARGALKLGALLMSLGYFLLVFGGPPAKQFLEVDGQRYPIITQSVGERPTQMVVVGEAHLALAPRADGGLLLSGPAQTAVPTELAKDSFTLPVERSQMFLWLTYLALAVVIVGNGLFKPNISTMVGALYSANDPRRDAGFTIFYMGINMGAFLGQLIMPVIRRDIGFNIAFLVAGIGMLIAFVMALRGDKTLAAYGNPPHPERLKERVFLGLNIKGIIVALAFVAVIPFWILLQHVELSRWILYVGNGALMLAIIAFAMFRLEKEARDRLIVAVILTMFSVVFWALFEQAGTSMTLYAERNTDRMVFGWEMPADQVQFFNALFIILLAPVFSIVWTVLGRKGWEPSTPVKFGLGLMQVGLGFLILVYGARYADGNALVPLLWIALAYLLHTTGELCLSPVGLSMITRLSVPSMVGLMMGVWFLSSSLAQAVGGVLAELTATETVAGMVLDPQKSLDTYVGVFQQIGVVAVGIGVFLLLLAPLLKKRMHGVN